MDLMDCEYTELYFDEPVSPEVEALLKEASYHYGEGMAEQYLLHAYHLAPKQLVVCVALYRYYFYQHRLREALEIAEKSMAWVGQRLLLPESWNLLHPTDVETLDPSLRGWLRFYLLVLKASAYLYLRLGHDQEGRTRLNKLIELDHHNRLGGQTLLKLITEGEETTLTT